MVDGRPDGFERKRQAVERFGKADEKPSWRFEVSEHPAEDLELDFSAEVNHDVAEEDGIGLEGEAVVVRKQVQDAEAHLLADFGTHAIDGLFAFFFLKEEFVAPGWWEGSELGVGIRRFASFLEDARGDVCGKDCEIESGVGIGEDHGEGIRFFTGGATGRPNHDGAAGASFFPIGNTILDKEVEMDSFAEEFGFVGSDGVEEVLEFVEAWAVIGEKPLMVLSDAFES